MSGRLLIGAVNGAGSLWLLGGATRIHVPCEAARVTGVHVVVNARVIFGSVILR